MTMTIKPPGRPQSIDEFLAMADKNLAPSAPIAPEIGPETVKPKRIKKPKVYPWEKPNVSKKLKKDMLLKLSESDFIKLDYIKEHTGQSKQRIIMQAGSAAIAAEIEKLINKGAKKDEN